MGRRMIWEPEVRRLVRERLVPLFYRAGSVSSLAERLNEARPAGAVTIHPNRLHGLLSEDEKRGLNDATFRAVGESGEAAFAQPDPSPDQTRRFADEVRGRVLSSSAAAKGDAVGPLAQQLGLPAAVVRCVLIDAGRAAEPGPPAAEPPAAPPPRKPDWSFQDEAVRRCRQALQRGAGWKVGLVIPTGGGKTRVALRVVLEELAAADPSARVAWVTHRRELRRQAREELQRLASSGVDVPAGTGGLLDRVDFVMVSRLRPYLDEARPALVVVDEAHHAAAASYSPLFVEGRAPRGLFLTATPNRTDELPIGIDEIAYSVTYRELEERGVVLMPRFDPFPVPDFSWDGDSVRELAEEVVSRANGPYVKALVIAPGIEKVRAFHAAIEEALLDQPGHVLELGDLGYIVSEGNSEGVSPEAFLDHFKAKPRAILVSADMLLEGYNDPAINAVVVTYPTTSLIRLMQAAGRCVRYTPGKQAAFVLQVRNDALAYHYDQGWLYQDISDFLRPELRELPYRDGADLARQIDAELDRRRVAVSAREAVAARLARHNPGDPLRLLFTGLPYYGAAERFGDEAAWSVVPADAADLESFRRAFNDFSALGAPDLKNSREFLARYVTPSDGVAGDWRLYHNMLLAMTQARRELGEGRSGCRPYRPNGATTWLTYLTCRQASAYPAGLETFLAACANRAATLAAYAESPARWAAAARVRLPLGGYIAFLLSADQGEWAARQRAALFDQLALAAPAGQFAALAAWRLGLESCPLPLTITERFDDVLSEEAWSANWLDLSGKAT